ncbi:NAD(P)-dependent oxidoreductase [Streptomyces avicenniae]|uniref:NAD(P)-dependent oxidoreductase n=1 Tax=Streptomyces avicenniae TaxID=500153 RepID=UPI000699897D|nr:NAD(P)H-binding protein [Streptomyces avicenniae]
MHITVIGAAGETGSRVVAEALRRHHDVTAATRRHGDATDPATVARLAAGQDVVVSATRPAPGAEHEHAAAALALLDGLSGTGVRLLVVGGAGSLTVPGTDGTLVVDDPRHVPLEIRPFALASNAQFAVFADAPADVDWLYVSPPVHFAPGERTGRYTVGADELLVDADGLSALSMEDMAVALLDEAEKPRHHRTRITVGRV